MVSLDIMPADRFYRILIQQCLLGGMESTLARSFLALLSLHMQVCEFLLVCEFPYGV